MEDAPSHSVLYFDPNKSTENFARLCQFLMTICSDVLRDILCQHIKPVDLRSELDKKRSKLEKITNVQEKNLLYPPHSSTSCVPEIRSRDLDLSLLYKILRNICNIPTHIAGWGNQPVSGDFSLAACIERIRILRNSVSGHSTSGTVNDAEFKDYWMELRKSVVEIEREVTGSDRYEKGIDHLHDCDLNPTKSKEYVAQIRRNAGEIIVKRERINLVEGEIIVKRERINLVEEEVNAKRVRLDNLEESHAELQERQRKLEVNFTQGLIDVKSAVLKELKEGLKIAKNWASRKDTVTYSSSRSTAIKFKSPVSLNDILHFSMTSTPENKCWLMVPRNMSSEESALHRDAGRSTLYLLDEVDIIKEFSIPKKYDIWLLSCNIITNDSEVVFISGRSLVAANEDGEFSKLFDISLPYKPNPWSVCLTPAGNYIFYIGAPLHRFIEYSKTGIPLRQWKIQKDFLHFMNDVHRNTNEDLILTNRGLFSHSQTLVIVDESFNLKCQVDIEPVGRIIPLMNNNCDLLYGHGQSIDLLDKKGRFVETVYNTNRQDTITDFAYSKNGTMWVLYDSFEIGIFKLEIPVEGST
ncbi:uncharacterized protein LOC133180482 [Saccostrea echinata]|uniref:uncharacterized protein LOC133180482 n=1 Tax=Saccostrea echinata TaxID=191078 RepID=UPI002A80D8F7|nr:uncharacterized protein LOC133180482 [Saccostrea echinata]